MKIHLTHWLVCILTLESKMKCAEVRTMIQVMTLFSHVFNIFTFSDVIFELVGSGGETRCFPHLYLPVCNCIFPLPSLSFGLCTVSVASLKPLGSTFMSVSSVLIGGNEQWPVLHQWSGYVALLSHTHCLLLAKATEHIESELLSILVAADSFWLPKWFKKLKLNI